MHLWSDERRLGTLELLFTMPVTCSQAIIGKFMAAWLFLGLALVLTFPIVVTVAYLGNPDYGVIVCGYIGSFLLAGSYLAIAGMTSAITRSQIVSFIISVVACLFLILAGWPPVTDMLVNWAPSGLVDAVSAFSVMPHFANMQRGVLDLRDIVYFSSVIVFSLFTTGIILKNHAAG
jgi:ABC-2 type transport system permease protein